MQPFYTLNVRLPIPLRDALFEYVEGEQEKAPLIPPTLSEVVRQIIAEKVSPSIHDNHRCETCQQPLPEGEGMT